MYYIWLRIFFGPIVYRYIRQIKGIENLPEDNYIIASNHSSFMDDTLLPAAIVKGTKGKRQFCIFINSRFYKNKLIKKFLDYYEMIPVDVGKDVKNKNQRKETNKKAFDTALKFVKEGRIFAIFPEGGRSTDGELLKAKTGVAKMALLTKVPVIPVGIKGSEKIWPKGSAFPKFKRADIIIGKPITFNEYFTDTYQEDYKTLEKITKKVMVEIAKLIGKEYKH